LYNKPLILWHANLMKTVTAIKKWCICLSCQT